MADEETQTGDEEVNDTVVEMAAETLRGDLRDSLLHWFKNTPKAWQVMSEAEQKSFAGRADAYARQLLRDACAIIAANERPTIVARLVEYKEKEGIEAKLKLLPTAEAIVALHTACGQDVLLVTTGYDDFAGQRGEVEIDADQHELPVEGDGPTDEPPNDDSDLNHGEHEVSLLDRVAAE